jgi:multisubunit Na+/H+ antiporter MnhC subunit
MLMVSFGKGGISRFILRKVVDSMASPSPLSICLTNMVIVFAVLVFLAFVIQLIHIVDPTKNKKK